VALFAVNPRQPWGYLGSTPAASTINFPINSIIYKIIARDQKSYQIYHKNFSLKSISCKLMEIISRKDDVAPQWFHNHIICDFYFSNAGFYEATIKFENLDRFLW
jgi:hypothetical protein